MKTVEEIKAEFDSLPKEEAREMFFSMLDRTCLLMSRLQRKTNNVRHYDDWLELRDMFGLGEIDWKEPEWEEEP